MQAALAAGVCVDKDMCIACTKGNEGIAAVVENGEDHEFRRAHGHVNTCHSGFDDMKRQHWSMRLAGEICSYAL
jgi:hypothetical protein